MSHGGGQSSRSEIALGREEGTNTRGKNLKDKRWLPACARGTRRALGQWLGCSTRHSRTPYRIVVMFLIFADGERSEQGSRYARCEGRREGVLLPAASERCRTSPLAPSRGNRWLPGKSRCPACAPNGPTPLPEGLFPLDLALPPVPARFWKGRLT